MRALLVGLIIHVMIRVITLTETAGISILRACCGALVILCLSLVLWSSHFSILAVLVLRLVIIRRWFWTLVL